jgi:hypothetical protein
MRDAYVLQGLINDHRFAREKYYLSKRLEQSLSDKGITDNAQHAVTEQAAVAWATAESALLSRHRSPFAVACAPRRALPRKQDKELQFIARCLRCGKAKNVHRASTLDCPRGKRTPVGYAAFGPEQFSPVGGEATEAPHHG